MPAQRKKKTTKQKPTKTKQNRLNETRTLISDSVLANPKVGIQMTAKQQCIHCVTERNVCRDHFINGRGWE